MSRSAAASALLALALAGVAFGAAGGSQLGRTTLVEVGVVLVGGGVVALAAARRPRPCPGGLVLLGFLALSVLTAASVAWSIDPETSWIEADRTLAYLAALAAGTAGAWLAPRSSSAVLRALLLAAAVVVGYGLVSRVWPAALSAGDVSARIGRPYGYWNAFGLTAALAVPPALWLGARRSGHAAANALAYPLLGLGWVALVLSYSRGALAVALIAVAAWLLLVPLRLRSLALVVASALGAVPVTLWATSQPAFARDNLPLEARAAVGGEFGWALALTALALLAVGLAVGFRLHRGAPGVGTRLRVGLVVAVVSLGVPLGLVAGVASSERGLLGTARAGVAQITNARATTPGGPQRLGAVSSSRAQYWREARAVWEERPWLGAGAGSFALARLRYRPDPTVARHAHGQIPQTAADLGLVGLAVLLLVVVAWLAAAARATGLLATLRRRPPAWDADRVGVAALTLSALVFGLHAALDWTWFVPGPTVMALVAAGWVAGKAAPAPRREAPIRWEELTPTTEVRTVVPTSALTAVMDRPPTHAHHPTNGARAVHAGRAGGDGGDSASLLANHPPETGPASSYARALAVVLLTLLSAYTITLPARSTTAADTALLLVETNHLTEARDSAIQARRLNPVSSTALLARANVESAAGDREAALALHRRAAREQPRDPDLWLALARYLADGMGRPREALRPARVALYLDPQAPRAGDVFLGLRARVRSEDAARATPVPAPAPEGELEIIP